MCRAGNALKTNPFKQVCVLYIYNIYSPHEHFPLNNYALAIMEFLCIGQKVSENRVFRINYSHRNCAKIF